MNRSAPCGSTRPSPRAPCVVPTAGDLARRSPRFAVSVERHDRLVDLVGEGLDSGIRIGGLADSSAMMRELADNLRILMGAPAYLAAAGRPSTPAERRGDAGADFIAR
jgi:DNA-binding transcriptional LysR family regulator